jgi:hypothetical protein
VIREMKTISRILVLSVFVSSVSLCGADPLTLDPNPTVQEHAPNSTSTLCPPVLADPLKKALCDEDQKAICSMEKISNQPTSAEIRKHALTQTAAQLSNLSASLSKYLAAVAPTSHLTPEEKEKKHQVAQAYVKVVQAVQNSVDAQFEAVGTKPSDLDARIEYLRQDLIQRITKYPTLANTPALETVKKLEIETPKRLAQMSDNDILTYYASCGSDGLTDQAYFDGTQSIVVCPGALLSVLHQGGNPNNLDFEIGHEMGHSIDPFAHAPGTMSLSFLDSYKNFLVCLNNHDKTEFEDLNDYYAVMKKEISLKQSCMTLLKKMTPAPNDEIEQTESDLAGLSSDDETNDWKTRFPAVKAEFSIADAVLTHSQEISADFMGTEAVADQIETMPADKKASYLESNLEIACDDPPDEAVLKIKKDCASATPQLSPSEYQELGDDGRHPSNPYRAHTIMHNPRIRKALGCDPLPADDPHPWCSLSTQPESK